MARLINLKLLADFFNKIDKKRTSFNISVDNRLAQRLHRSFKRRSVQVG